MGNKYHGQAELFLSVAFSNNFAGISVGALAAAEFHIMWAVAGRRTGQSTKRLWFRPSEYSSEILGQNHRSTLNALLYADARPSFSV